MPRISVLVFVSLLLIPVASAQDAYTLTLVDIPGGTFTQGEPESEYAGRPGTWDAPEVSVTLSDFRMSDTEVTNAQYAQCVAAGACTPPRSSQATYHNAYYGAPAYDDFPVIQVSWYDAQTFCDWRDARLPSEAEWEKAAGFDPVQSLKLRYPWGDAFDGTKLNFCDAGCPLDKRDASINDGHQDTAPVGSYMDGRSPIGLYDMAGNVMEWVDDWYDPRAYADMTDTNPRGPLEGEFKTLRGGSWLSDADEVTVTVRGSFDPTVARAMP